MTQVLISPYRIDSFSIGLDPSFSVALIAGLTFLRLISAKAIPFRGKSVNVMAGWPFRIEHTQP